MGVPLLLDVVESMEQAIKAKEEHHTPGTYEKARLRFAHAETVVPFSCLLGLFLDGDEFAQIQQEQPLELPSKSPQRSWRGSVVAPFSGNNMLVLYSCPADNNTSKYFVQVLHNEVPLFQFLCRVVIILISARSKFSRRKLSNLILSTISSRSAN